MSEDNITRLRDVGIAWCTEAQFEALIAVVMAAQRLRPRLELGEDAPWGDVAALHDLDTAIDRLLEMDTAGPTEGEL